MDKLLEWIRKQLEKEVTDLVSQSKSGKMKLLKLQVETHFFDRLSSREGNLYSHWGIPQSHNGWDMQFLFDQGRLFYLFFCALKRYEFLMRGYERGKDTIFQHTSASAPASTSFKDLEKFYRTFYKEAIPKSPPKVTDDDYLWELVQYAIIKAYMQWACLVPDAYITLDLFPTSVVDPKGDLVDKSFRSSSSSYESYSRVYTVKLCQLLNKDNLGRMSFALVVPYTNTVPNINRTNAMPMDGVENTIHYLHDICQYCTKGPKEVYILGYSQAGAVVKLVNEFLCDPNMLKKHHDILYQTTTRGLLTSQKSYTYLVQGHNTLKNNLMVNTISLAPMGGLTVCTKTDQVVSGVLTKKNKVNGTHLSICHHLDPVTNVIPKEYGLFDGVHFYANLIHFQKGSTGFLHGLLFSSKISKSEDLYLEKLTSQQQQIFNEMMKSVQFVTDKLGFHNSSQYIGEGKNTQSELKMCYFPEAHLGIFGYPMKEVARVFKNVFVQHYQFIGVSSWDYDIYPVSKNNTKLFDKINRKSPFK